MALADDLVKRVGAHPDRERCGRRTRIVRTVVAGQIEEVVGHALEANGVNTGARICRKRIVLNFPILLAGANPAP